jgi:rod shape determining protein RodA
MTGISLLRRIDWVLVVAVALLLYIGTRAVQSGTAGDLIGDPSFFVRRHLIYIVLGVAAGVATMLIDPRLYRRFIWPIYGVAIALLVIVLGFSAARGSQRWIPLPFFTLQPSEVGKAALIIVASVVIADAVRRGATGWRLVGRAGIVMGPLFMLVFIQPDLGTSLAYLAITAAILAIAGLGWRQFAVIGAGALSAALLIFAVLPSIGLPLLRPYQIDRITAFLNPEGGSPAVYQSEQARIAIGSGGLTGRGEGASQTAGNFLPEHHTDFVFAVVAENRGFVGAVIVLLLYMVVLWRIARVIPRARTLDDSLIAAGALGMMLVQITINLGMVVGLAPTTGIPLPFMTYGGSNTIINLVVIGLVLAVTARVPSERVRRRSLGGPLRRRRPLPTQTADVT